VQDREPSQKNLVAVVVTHHPDADVPERLRALTSQFDRVIVVDNHSDPDELAALRGLIGRPDGIDLIENPANLGIAAALNQGCREAELRGAAWVALFDQDSTPATDFCSFAAGEWRVRPDRERIGLIGVNFRTSTGKPLITEGTGLVDARVVITSGSLLNLDAWRQVGAFREDFFIDEVDHEYAIRLRRHGWQVKVTRRVLMDHVIGLPQTGAARPWTPILSHHSALRRYYMVRNRLLLAREHLRFEPMFISSQLARTLRECATVLLFEPQKAAKLRAMWMGFFDGVRGRSGRAAWHAP
jgi:rhamnosyltransferase